MVQTVVDEERGRSDRSPVARERKIREERRRERENERWKGRGRTRA